MTGRDDVDLGGGGFHNLEADIANLLVTGKHFKIGPRTFRVDSVLRGSVSDLDRALVPLIVHRCENRPSYTGIPPWCALEAIAQLQRRLGVSCHGDWKMGFYEDPERDERSPLVVSFQLERVR